MDFTKKEPDFVKAHLKVSNFGCRNIKPSLKFSKIVDSKASEEEGKRRCITELDDIKTPPLSWLAPKSIFQYRREVNSVPSG
jgi:hypothetical protein